MARSRDNRRVGVGDNPASGADTVAEIGEFGLIRQATGDRPQPSTTLLGPGDDAAVVAAPDGRVVVATDARGGRALQAGLVHPDARGRKAVAVNLADIAAMGAVPMSVVVTLAVPRTPPPWPLCWTVWQQGETGRGGRREA